MSTIQSPEIFGPSCCFLPYQRGENPAQMRVMKEIQNLGSEKMGALAGYYSIWEAPEPNRFNIHYIKQICPNAKRYMQTWQPIEIQNGMIKFQGGKTYADFEAVKTKLHLTKSLGEEK